MPGKRKRKKGQKMQYHFSGIGWKNRDVRDVWSKIRVFDWGN